MREWAASGMSRIRLHNHITEAVSRRCFVEKVVLKILQNLQENACAGVFLIRLATLRERGSSTGVFM